MGWHDTTVAINCSRICTIARCVPTACGRTATINARPRCPATATDSGGRSRGKPGRPACGTAPRDAIAARPWPAPARAKQQTLRNGPARPKSPAGPTATDCLEPKWPYIIIIIHYHASSSSSSLPSSSSAIIIIIVVIIIMINIMINMFSMVIIIVHTPSTSTTASSSS